MTRSADVFIANVLTKIIACPRPPFSEGRGASSTPAFRRGRVVRCACPPYALAIPLAESEHCG